MAPPSEGRRYRSSRRVRLGDVGPSGELRLDAVARYLQDIASDDVDEAGINGEAGWVVRRSTLEVTGRPLYEDVVEMTTWCSGTGAAWAERRTSISSKGRSLVEGASLWVCMDTATMRPRVLGDRFFGVYGAGARARPVPSRLRLATGPPPGSTSRRWPLRHADFDVLGHVNNAIAWAAIEQEVALSWSGLWVVQAEVEYRRPIEDSDDLAVVGVDQDGLVGVWLIEASGEAAVSALVRLATRPDR